jgi:hypothetical protein
VAVHVDQLSVDELNPEQAMIEDIVKPFLPPHLKYLRALNATREIVNGFKYEIIFVMRDEHEDEIYCVMDVLEKPWLMRDEKKFRKMTYNNCSLENPSDDDDQMRFQFDINPTFVNQRTELTDEDLSEMEDQIVVEQPRSTTEKISTTTEDEITLAPLNSNSKNLLDDFFNTNNFFPPPQTSTTTSTAPPIAMDALDEMFGMKKVENFQSEPQSRSSDESSSSDDNLQQKEVDEKPSSNNSTLKDLETDIKKVFSELFQTNPEFQSNIIALINRKDDTTAHKNYNFVISILASKLKDKIEISRNGEGDIRRKREINDRIREIAAGALDTLDHIDVDNKKRVLVRILSVKQIEGKKVIEATVANSLCRENFPEKFKCDENIDQNSIKVCLFEVKIGNFEILRVF